MPGVNQGIKMKTNKLLSTFIAKYKFPAVIKKKAKSQFFTYNSLKYKFAEKGLYFTENEKKLAKLKNIHCGERCIIIGNGPSLNKCDMTRLKNEYTFGVNNIFLNYEKMGYYPTYYVVEDTLVAEDRAQQINAYDHSIKFFGNYLNYCLEKTGETIWLNVIFRYDEYENFPNFSQNALTKIWVGGTVSYLCMQLAYYMGFKNVYLVGFDHSYEIPTNAKIDGDKILSMSDDPNHFDSSYFGKGYRWHDPKVDRMELSYRKAKQYFEQDGRKIYNATVGGHLDVFDKVDYDNIF
jgi:hypothetical protein